MRISNNIGVSEEISFGRQLGGCQDDLAAGGTGGISRLSDEPAGVNDAFRRPSMITSVGCRKLEVRDTQSAGSGTIVPVLVMYPTLAPPGRTQMGPYELDLAMGAPIEKGHYPLVVISHGSSGSPMVFRTLAQHLARSGYIVCVPEHPGDSIFNNELQYSLRNLIDRPRHVSLVLDALCNLEDWKDCVQAQSVAVIGHSVGGYTALALAGGHPHTRWMVDFSHQPENFAAPSWTALVRKNKLTSQPVEVTPDRRIKAIVLLAPDVSLFMDIGALADVHVPVLLRVAEKDDWPRETIQTLSHGLPDPARLDARIVENGNHYCFISAFPDSLRDKVGEAAVDPAGFDRLQFQQVLQEQIVGFLTKALERKGVH